LGGAEFRLPLLISIFGFAALEAVILNKAMSLIVVTSALVFRSAAVPVHAVLSHFPIVLTLLSGSLLGAWLGADIATRLSARALYRVIALLLVAMAIVLTAAHRSSAHHPAFFTGYAQIAAGVGAGFIIGIVAALLGVAGGELIIPTLVLLFGVEIKLAGSLSLVVSLPTMLVAFARYSRDRTFDVLRAYPQLVATMAAGSIAGALSGGLLLGIVSSEFLLPLLIVVLILSAIKLWRSGTN